MRIVAARPGPASGQLLHTAYGDAVRDQRQRDDGWISDHDCLFENRSPNCQILLASRMNRRYPLTFRDVNSRLRCDHESDGWIDLLFHVPAATAELDDSVPDRARINVLYHSVSRCHEGLLMRRSRQARWITHNDLVSTLSRNDLLELEERL